jgi:hypothetical protein
MGRRRKPGAYPYDYTDADARRFAGSGIGGTLRVLHGPGRGMGVTEGVACRVTVTTGDGEVVDESSAGKLGKEHRLHATVTGDRVSVSVVASFDGDGDGDGDGACGCGSPACARVLDELTATRDVVLTGDLDDVVRFGVGPAWADVLAIDTGEPYTDVPPTGCRWGAGVRLRGGRTAEGVG